MHSIEFKLGMYIADQRRTNAIDFREYRMHSFFYRSTRKNSFTLRPMESNSLECSSIQMVHSNELKFGMYITGHRRTNPIDFGEYRMNSFFYRSTKKDSYTLRPMEPNSFKYSSVQMIHLIELKFGTYIIDHCSTNYLDFGE